MRMNNFDIRYYEHLNTTISKETRFGEQNTSQVLDYPQLFHLISTAKFPLQFHVYSIKSQETLVPTANN